MKDAGLYNLLGLSRERADEIARIVRISFSESNGPSEYIELLAKKFSIDPEQAEIFACGWFAGKYAGVSEVFNIMQREIDKVEKESERSSDRYRYVLFDGYA